MVLYRFFRCRRSAPGFVTQGATGVGGIVKILQATGAAQTDRLTGGQDNFDAAVGGNV